MGPGCGWKLTAAGAGLPCLLFFYKPQGLADEAEEAALREEQEQQEVQWVPEGEKEQVGGMGAPLVRDGHSVLLCVTHLDPH